MYDVPMSYIYLSQMFFRFYDVRCFLFIWFLCSLTQEVECQASIKDITLVNQQILFVNETMHGSLVLHRIYESYNQDINKYVDLPSYNLNNYDNGDLPDDIFEDPNRWFYQKSPNGIYKDLAATPSTQGLPANTQSVIRSIKSISENLNRDRIGIETIITTENLNQLTTIQKVYEQLESVVDYYARLESEVSMFERVINSEAFNVTLPEDKKQVYRALMDIHLDIKKAIRHIGNDNQSGVISILSKINKENNWLRQCLSELKSPKEKEQLTFIFNTITGIVNYLNEYLNDPKVPQEYALFGKGYFYKNVILLTKINRYGNGYVSILNEFFNENNWSVIHFLEEPHFLKIIYPELTPKDLLSKPIEENITLEQLKNDKVLALNKKPSPPPVDSFFLKSSTKKEEKIKPQDLPLKITGTHVLYVDSLVFEVELYDHLIKDGDRVSINVNGEWIFTDISLEKEPQRIKLSINPDQENFILIQAVNIGWRPPNTVGLTYRSNGKVENFLLKSDLNSTELVQIKYRPN